MPAVLLSRGRCFGAALVSLALLAPALPAAASSYAGGASASGRSTLSVTSTDDARVGGDITVQRDRRGHAHYVGAEAGRVLARSAGRGQTPTAAARAQLGGFAAEFGIKAPERDLQAASVGNLARGQSVVRFQQTAGGLPVFGGQLASVLDDANNLLSLTGETSQSVRSAAFAVSARAARRAALRVTAADTDLDVRALRASAPQRWLYDPSLLNAAGAPGATAVWRFDVTAPGLLDVRELVLVDARTGEIALHIDQIQHALYRVVCDNGGAENDDYLCTKTHYRRIEGTPDTGAADVDAAFLNAGAASNFFATFGVDLTSLIGSDYGDGKKIRSTVGVCPTSGGCPYDNAFWDGFQMVYGAGFPRADDVVAHELSHGVTQHTSGLVYWYQSGAINESMSDVFGELVDLSDGIGNDDPSVRWQLGEDLPSIPGEDLTRNLRDPLAHGQPDRVNGSFWTSSGSDSGGVHTNSGVGNKAAYLITDGTAGEPGGTFNGQTIPVGLGVEKASQIYWRTEQLLTPGADYSDLANALVAACSSLAAGGIAGITASDCSDVVAKATVATQMQAFSGPTAPRSLKILGGYKQIHLTWTRPAAAGSAPITSYVLIVKPAIQGENFLPIDDPKAHDVRIGGIPAGRTFTFSLVAVTPFGNSPAASLILQGTKLSMSVKRSVAFGSRAKIKGRLTLTNGSGVRGRHVTLYRKVAGKSGYHKVKTKTTSRTGRYTFKQRQTAKTSYYVQFASKVPGLMGARSTKRPVKVRRWVSLRANDQTVRVGTAVSFTGRVDPASGAVTLQRRPATGQQASTWSRVARDRLDGSGRYRLGWTARSGRDFAWRVVAPAHHGLDRGVSRTRVVRVT